MSKLRVFLLVMKRLPNYQFKAVKSNHSSQSAANLNIYQNIFKNFYLKIVPSKSTFPKLLLDTFSKLPPEKMYFKHFL